MGRLTIPYVPVNGASNLIDATSVNLNFNAIATAVNNVDNTQIGAAGIYANQVIPTNTSQATFGGSQPYTFSGALATGGPAQVVRTNGDLEVKRSSSTGLITIGGSSGYATLDYGITNSGVLTISKGLNTPASFYNTLASYSWTGDSGYSSSIGAGSTNIVAGVSGSAWNISTAASGGQFLSAQDQSGNFGIKSSLAVGTSVSAQSGVFPGQAGLSLGGLYANAGVPGFSAYGGSIYIRTDGSSGARIYVNQASGTTGSSWTAIAGV
jgi:hypothetical protein